MKLLNTLIIAGVLGALLILLGIIVWSWVFVVIAIMSTIGAGQTFAISTVLLSVGLIGAAVTR